MDPKLKELVSEMESINSKETLSKEEEDRYQSLEAEVSEVLEKIDEDQKKDGRAKKIADLKAKLSEPTDEPKKADARNDEPEKQFRSLGEFVKTIRFNPYDPRLTKRTDDQEMGDDELGGYLVPDEYQSEIKLVIQENSIVRARATVIPAGASPDATVKMPALDQTAEDGTGLYGGIDVTWISEGGTKVQQETAFKEISLSPYEVAGSIVVTDKLLRNAPAIEPLVTRLFRGALASAEEDKFLSGDGTGCPTGFIGHASNVAVNRQTANKIVYADIVNMFTSKLSGGSYVWVASGSALAELMKMKDFESADSDAPSLVFQPDARAGMPGSMLGIPVLSSDLVPTLGTKGDLSLVDFSYYLIKDGYGVAIDASPHVYFQTNKTMIKAFNNVDGSPWLTAPIVLRDGSTQVSPFVVLDVPSTSS